MIRNTSQENKSPSSGSHSSPLSHTTSIAPDSHMFQFSFISQDIREGEGGVRGGEEGRGGGGEEEEDEEEEEEEEAQSI